MKKLTIFTIMIILAILLTACGSSASTGNGNGQGQSQGFDNRPISPQMELAVGIFKLEGTPQAVDAKEAAQLLPLWQLFGQLETSSSSAPQEVTAALDQIKATMTPDQMSAISAMKLTNQDAFTFLQQAGIMQAGGFGNGTPDANRTPRAGGGDFPGGGGGGFPGGSPGGAGGNGQNLSPSQIATAQARRSQGGGFSNRLSPGVLDAMIKLLQSKITPGITSTPGAPTTVPMDTPTVTPTP